MASEFATIEKNINYNILRAKITKAICDFAIECIEPIKDKATTQRVIPSVYHPNDKDKTLYHAWQKDFEIDGFKGYFSVTLGKHDWNGKKVLRLYSHAYSEEQNCYAPEPSVGEVWRVGEDGEQTWETFLAELRSLSESHTDLPSREQIEKFLDDCQALKDACKLWQERREEFSVYGGGYISENPSRWQVRGDF